MGLLNPYLCPLCSGDGHHYSQSSEHHPWCGSEGSCNELCPIAVEKTEPCAGCAGLGRVDYNLLVELVTTALDYLSPMDQSEIIQAALKEADGEYCPMTAAELDDKLPF